MHSFHKDQINIPNLYIVGFQKCGSSSLFALLCQHPEIKGVIPKETFALTDAAYENYNSGKSVLNPNFLWNEFYTEDNKYKFLVEGSVCNFYQETALDYIKGIPGSKVLFIIRDPLERFLSNFNYFGGSGIHLKPGIKIGEFYKMVKSQHTELKKEPLKYAIDHGKYTVYIQKWKDYLGPERIHVVGFRQLIRNPLDTINAIYTFLGLSPLQSVNMIHKNKSKVSRFPGLNRFMLSRFGNGKFRAQFIRSLYLSLMRMDARKTKLPDEVSIELKKIYSREYQEFGNLF